MRHINASGFTQDVAVMETNGAIETGDLYDPVVGGHQMKNHLGYGEL